MQFRVLRLGFLQDGDVGIGVLPEGEEVLILGAGLHRIAGEGVSAGEVKVKVGQCAKREVQHDPTVIEQLLKLGGCGAAVRDALGDPLRASRELLRLLGRRRLADQDHIRFGAISTYTEHLVTG